MKYEPLSSELFIENRKSFIQHMAANSFAIFNASSQFPRSGDQDFHFKQNADLFYLAGIDQELTLLLLYPDAPEERYREMLFLRESNAHIEQWEGRKLTQEGASRLSGIAKESIFSTKDFEGLLTSLAARADNIYLNTNENDRYSHQTAYKDLDFVHWMQHRYPLHRYLRAAPILKKLRTVKNRIEVEATKRACDITANAFQRILPFVKPGVFEYQIEAEITHEFLNNRSTGHAYAPIVASGADSCILHYIENSKECKDGDLVLLDFGAEYANYNADLTRTIPVNGTFTARQRQVYDAVLGVFKEAKRNLVAGSSLQHYRDLTDRLMENALLALGLISVDQIKNQLPHQPAFKKFFPHGISHFLGLDVHDLGDRYETIQPGMIFTCEPGIYIKEEGLGIRIENDILITADGQIDLMAHIPIEAEEIEQLMHPRNGR